MNPLLRRRARSVGGESSNGSHHRHEIRVQDYEVHPAYDVPSPQRDDTQGPAENFQPEDEARRTREEATSDLRGGLEAVTCSGEAANRKMVGTGHASDLIEGADSAARDDDVMSASFIAGSAQRIPASFEVPALPPGCDGEVPLGPVEAQVTSTKAPGPESGESYIARSIDAMGNVLSSLLGRMASLEQRSSNRSSTPTSDGIDLQLQQLSLEANPLRRGDRPLLPERPLASMDRIMAGTFSSDDSETARRRADEARRVIPGGLMRVPGPPPQHVMSEQVAPGVPPGMLQSSPSMPVNVGDQLQHLPPVPPSTLGYFVPPEGRDDFGIVPSGGFQPYGDMAPGVGVSAGTPLPREQRSRVPVGSWPTPTPFMGMSGPAFPQMGSCLGMPSYLSSPRVALPSTGSCLPMTKMDSGDSGQYPGAQGPVDGRDAYLLRDPDKTHGGSGFG